MSDDRFKPPQTPVVDPRVVEARAPLSVRNACGLILLSMVLGYATLLPGIRPPAPAMTAGHMMFAAGWVLFFSWLTYWLTGRLRQRSHAARWQMLALLGSGWLLMVLTFQSDFNDSPIFVVIELLTSALEVWAVWLLFTGASAKWFATR